MNQNKRKGVKGAVRRRSSMRKGWFKNDTVNK
jgi:hypothetical protein